jgi:tetratricopeptide (TPR) repeat protein
MSDSDTSGSPWIDNTPTGGQPPKAEGTSFWKAKVGGGAVGLWLLIALARNIPKLMDNANRDNLRPQVQQPPDMAKVDAILKGVARRHVEQQVDKTLAASADPTRLNPRDADGYRTRGYLWLGKREYDKAIADYTEAIRLNPKDAEAHRFRAFAWINKADFPKAFADLDEAIRLNPTDAKALINRGILRKSKREYDKAIDDYTAAIRTDPKSAWAYHELAWQYATCPDPKFRNGKKAIENAAYACKLTEMKQAVYIGTLAAAYAEAGDFGEATRCQWLADNLYSDAEKQRWQHLRGLYESGKPYREEVKK